MIIVIQPREMGIFSGHGSGSGAVFSIATAHPILQVTGESGTSSPSFGGVRREFNARSLLLFQQGMLPEPVLGKQGMIPNRFSHPGV